ncbi:MAG: hypothetical protein U9Q82_04780 [Chloroflexota bacterium]|nr:hypothetical protein [Chloroflexota bacterium]
MARKRKKKKRNYQIPISQVRPLKMRGPRYYLKHAREYPILGCWIYAQWKTSGIAPVVVAREQPNNRVVIGVCLIDSWCLGIKNAYAKVDASPNLFKRKLPQMCSDDPQKVSVEFAHDFIYGAKEYAEKYGFEPHKDFTKLMVNKVLDPPDMHPRSNAIEFGKDGKPFYASGPNDDERKINHIIRTLKRTAGEGNYDILIKIGPPPGFDEF